MIENLTTWIVFEDKESSKCTLIIFTMNESVQWANSSTLNSLEIKNDTVVITDDEDKEYHLPLEKYGWNQITYFDYNYLLEDFNSHAVSKDNLEDLLCRQV